MNKTATPTTQVFPDSAAASQALAMEVVALIKSREAQGLPTVLGLATGGTPIQFYEALRKLHSAGEISFRTVTTFNLDEYLGLDRADPHSYWQFMHEQLFDHVDILPDNIHVPDGTIADSELEAYCRSYESSIVEAGGIDLQILGIGTNGHIGFNEPGAARDSRTRVVDLCEKTRNDNAVHFTEEQQVPTRAISMGCATILDAKRIALMAWGERKAATVQSALHGPITPELPASFLQEHPDTTYYLDKGSAGGS